MISLQDLKRNYVKFYTEVKNYIWPFDAVKDLAELEVAIFDRFPDMHNVRNLFNRFRSDIYNEIYEYEELKEAVDKFQEFIEKDDDIYSQLSAVTEDYTNESIEDKKPSKKKTGKGGRTHKSRITVSRTAS